MQLSKRIVLIVGAIATFSGASSVSAADFFAPTPYLSEADSPFLQSNGGPFVLGGPDFYLEDFEDQSLDTPGIAGIGQIWDVATTDSVDGDDGSIDGSGSNGVSFALIQDNPFIEFTFSPVFDGALPSHAGLVWTDGDPFVAPVPVTFEAWDASGASLGTQEAMLGDGVNTGTTAEDRFFGVFHQPGISRIRVTNNEDNPNFGIEADHVQYGRAAPPVPVMSPVATGLMTTLSMVAAAFALRRS